MRAASFLSRFASAIRHRNQAKGLQAIRTTSDLVGPFFPYLHCRTPWCLPRSFNLAFKIIWQHLSCTPT